MKNKNNRCKNICWTCFDLSDKVLENLNYLVTGPLQQRGPADYCVWQHELAPDTGKEHLQGYTEFSKEMYYSEIKKLFGTDKVHCEARKGSAEQAAAYCKKDASRKPGSLIFEQGVMKGKGDGQGKRTDLAAIAEMVLEKKSLRDIAMEFPSTYMRTHKGIKEFKLVTAEKRTKHTVCFIIYGASNSGKSTWVRKAFPDACWITKGVSGCWFDEYDGQETIVFDEFAGWMPFTWFKRLIDQTPLSLDAKGASKNMNPTTCVFISNNPPDTWWSDEVLTGDNKAAFLRRQHLVFSIKELLGPGDMKTGLFSVRMKNAVLPYNAPTDERFRLAGLDSEKSLEVMAEATAKARRQELKILSGSGKWEVGSGGVILHPPPHLEPGEFITDAMNHYIGHIFGTIEESAQAAEPSQEPVQEQEEEIPHELGRIGVDFPDPSPPEHSDFDMSGFKIGQKRKEKALARTKPRRKCPYIDDQAEEE